MRQREKEEKEKEEEGVGGGGEGGGGGGRVGGEGGFIIAGIGLRETDPGHGDRWCLGGGGGPEGLHPRGGGGAGKGICSCLCQASVNRQPSQP